MANTSYQNIQRGYYNVDGKDYFFRSKWEANYALYLNFLVKQRQIKAWEYEPECFVFEKIKFGTRSYRPDFKITKNDGTFEYHEVKGFMNAKSATKLKRMKIYFPDVKVILVSSETYQDIKNKLGKMLRFY